jgi:hypothetical protein
MLKGPKGEKRPSTMIGNGVHKMRAPLTALIGILIVALMLQIENRLAHADSADTSAANALRLCAVFDSEGDESEPCKVSGWSASVEVSIDTSGPEARKICEGTVKMLTKLKVTFNGWKLKIYSPFSAGKTIAVCDLPYDVPLSPPHSK